MPQPIPLILRVLNEQLHFAFHGPERVQRLDIFTVDLSDWKLSLGDQTPCIWIHTLEQLGQSPIDLAEEIRDLVRHKKWQTETVFVLVDGAADELRRNLQHSHFAQFVIFDEKQQKQVSEAASATRVVLDLLLNQMSRTQLAPYETTRPVTGSRFFGRKEFLNKILTHPKDNFIVIGIRRIGKSSLLHEVKRIMDQTDPPADGEHRRLYVDCSVIKTAEELYREIIARLSPRDLKRLEREGHSQRLRARLFEYLSSQNGGPITFFLDEIDSLLEQPQQSRSLFEVLRHASEQNHAARFIIAGFRYTQRAVMDLESPLYHFGDTLTMRPLKREDLRQMVEGPMEHLRIKLTDRDEIIQRIHHETAGMPNLVQFYCKTLLECLEESGDPAHGIAPSDIQSVYDNPDFRDFVLTTFMNNSRPLERAVIFAIANRKDTREGKAFTYQTIDAELSQRKLHVHMNALDEAIRNLVTAGILQALGNKHYHFSIPLFAKMLEENYQLNFIFEKTRQELEREPLVEVR